MDKNGGGGFKNKNFSFQFIITHMSYHFISASRLSRVSTPWHTLNSQEFSLYLKKSQRILMEFWDSKNFFLNSLIILLSYCKQSARQVNYVFKIYYKYIFVTRARLFIY